MTSATSSSRTAQTRWTENEDNILRARVTKYSASCSTIPWNQVAESLPGRSNKDCRKRWINTACGQLKKGPWEPDEDRRLMDAVSAHGQKWTTVAQKLTRLEECSKRWQHSLDPRLDRSVWTPEEDRRLVRAVESVGREWRNIQGMHFASRSANDLKNRFSCLERKAKQPEGPPDSDDDSSCHGETPTGEDEVIAEFDMAGPLSSDNMDIDQFLQSQHYLDVDFHSAFGVENLDPHKVESTQEAGACTSGEDFRDLESIFSSGQNRGTTQSINIAHDSLTVDCTVSDTGRDILDTSLLDSDFLNHTDLTKPSHFVETVGSKQLTVRANPQAETWPLLPTTDRNAVSTNEVHQPVSPVRSYPFLQKGIQNGCVSLKVDGCDRNVVDYLLDVTQPIKDIVKMEIKM